MKDIKSSSLHCINAIHCQANSKGSNSPSTQLLYLGFVLHIGCQDGHKVMLLQRQDMVV